MGSGQPAAENGLLGQSGEGSEERCVAWCRYTQAAIENNRKRWERLHVTGIVPLVRRLPLFRDSWLLRGSGATTSAHCRLRSATRWLLLCWLRAATTAAALLRATSVMFRIAETDRRNDARAGHRRNQHARNEDF